MIVAWVVLTECQRVTDRQTDGRTDGFTIANTALCIAGFIVRLFGFIVLCCLVLIDWFSFLPSCMVNKVGYIGLCWRDVKISCVSDLRCPVWVWKSSNGHSATRHPIDFVFGSRVGFSGTADRTAPFLVVSSRHFVNSHEHIFETHFRIHVMYVHRLYFVLALYNDLAQIMIGEWTLISHERVASRPKV